jgi:hypothetical protein
MDQPLTVVEINYRKAYGSFTTLHNTWRGDFLSQKPTFCLVGGHNGGLERSCSKSSSYSCGLLVFVNPIITPVAAKIRRTASTVIDSIISQFFGR